MKKILIGSMAISFSVLTASSILSAEQEKMPGYRKGPKMTAREQIDYAQKHTITGSGRNISFPLKEEQGKAPPVFLILKNQAQQVKGRASIALKEWEDRKAEFSAMGWQQIETPTEQELLTSSLPNPDVLTLSGENEVLGILEIDPDFGIENNLPGWEKKIN